MGWLYKLLGFKKLKVMFIDKNLAAIEFQENDDFEMTISSLRKIKHDIKDGDYLWVK